MERIHFEYRRSAATEGLRNLIVGTLTILVLFVTQIRLVGTADKVMFIVMVLFDVVLGGLTVTASILDLTSGKTFLFRVTDSTIECDSPSTWGERSFRLPVDRIARIEEGSSDSGKDVWYLIDRRDVRYRIDRNYGLPSRDVIESIRRHHPQLLIG